VVAALAPRDAAAALGGDVSSVLHDHAVIGATAMIDARSGYDVYAGTSADGRELREYVDRSGRVFAVAWKGTRPQNIAALLGESASRYVAAATRHQNGHHIVNISEPDLALSVVKLPGGWVGHAVLPQAVPAGVARSDLR
jgi:hypothetical protein